MKYLLFVACMVFIVLAAFVIFNTSAEPKGVLGISNDQLNHFSHTAILERIDNLNIHMLRTLITNNDINDTNHIINIADEACYEDVNVNDSILGDSGENGFRPYDLLNRRNNGSEYWKYLEGNIFISVYNHRTGEVLYMDLEEYIVGVVFSEMPASFEIEALKAQAVAARSYTVYKIVNLREEERALHNGAVICTDFAHCQAHITFEEAMARHVGNIDDNDNISDEILQKQIESFEYFWNRVRDAVFATEGEIITYDNAPAIAVFHAMSGDMTESAKHVWNHAVPYLIAVPTKEADNRYRIRNFQTEARFTFEEFKEILNVGGFGADLPRNPRHWIEYVSRNPTGRVAYIMIYGEIITGIQLRELFALRSTNFTLELTEDGVFVFTVQGHGHGVGMSQYGANLMAQANKTYIDILKWYYSGIEISSVDRFLIHYLKYSDSD